MEKEGVMNTRSLLTASLIAALGLGIAALPAVAQGPGAGGGPGGGPGAGGGRGAMMFQRLDTNGDGKITKDELKTGRDTRYVAMDQNDDGKITWQEFQAAPRPGKQGPRMQQMFQRADTNGDGVINRDEFDKKADLRFKPLDLNGDGVIARDEAQQAMGNVRGSGKGRGSAQGQGPGGGPREAGPGRTQQ
jgi:EF hand/EF-hand domain pair